ncbi:uncharacterized protein LOC128721061 [Anopheles nili]|uniref:uncharacterized protein LOC128721061 n=1 Tax=Anopheles nili TaxID=185578 RepID=UPI00237ABCB4|nr:uncharacterized protein LOC128721061 [Anopheles nili]
MNNHGTIEEQWTKKPYKTSEFPKVIKEENDSDGEESMLINEGIKSRAPRVNFITQQTKSRLSPTETRDTGSEKVIRELYRKPLASIFYERPLPRDHDSFMAPSQPPLYPPMYPKYHDTFQRDMMDRLHPPAPHRYDQYYERRYDVDYDSYFPRYKFPHYYYYPDKHFDVPLYYRNPNYFYTNEIEIASARPAVSATYNDRLPPSTTVRSTVGPAMRNRRIIYFATLPEIVRPSPNLDMYHRYPIGSMGTKYEPFYSIKTPQPPIAYKNSRPLANDRKDDKYVVSKPIKIIRDAEATRRGRLSMSQEATDSTRSSLRNDGLLLGIQRTYFRGGL